MSKLKTIVLFFLVCISYNLFAEEEQITFHYKPDHKEYRGESEFQIYTGAVVSDAGKIFIWQLANDSEIPYENERFIFPKNDNYRCLGLLHAIAIDELDQATGRVFVFKPAHLYLSHGLILFLQNNVWEMDWEKINELRDMATFEIISSPGGWFNEPSTIAKNKYRQFILPRGLDDFVGGKIRFFHYQHVNHYRIGIIEHHGVKQSGYGYVLVDDLPKKMLEYIKSAISDLEAELGAKIDGHYFN